MGQAERTTINPKVGTYKRRGGTASAAVAVRDVLSFLCWGQGHRALRQLWFSVPCFQMQGDIKRLETVRVSELWKARQKNQEEAKVGEAGEKRQGGELEGTPAPRGRGAAQHGGPSGTEDVTPQADRLLGSCCAPPLG